MVDRTVLWKSAAVQLLSVAVFSIVLAVLLPKSFFQSWGWLSGPVAWLICSQITATVLGLPRWSVLVGAVLAGIPSLVAVLIGVHWLGAVLATILFALWCGYRFADGQPLSERSLPES